MRMSFSRWHVSLVLLLAVSTGCESSWLEHAETERYLAGVTAASLVRSNPFVEEGVLVVPGVRSFNRPFKQPSNG
jgi:hypothetical protein